MWTGQSHRFTRPATYTFYLLCSAFLGGAQSDATGHLSLWLQVLFTLVSHSPQLYKGFIHGGGGGFTVWAPHLRPHGAAFCCRCGLSHPLPFYEIASIFLHKTDGPFALDAIKDQMVHQFWLWTQINHNPLCQERRQWISISMWLLRIDFHWQLRFVVPHFQLYIDLNRQWAEKGRNSYTEGNFSVVLNGDFGENPNFQAWRPANCSFLGQWVFSVKRQWTLHSSEHVRTLSP